MVVKDMDTGYFTVLGTDANVSYLNNEVKGGDD